MELMDWKNIEKSAEDSIASGKIQIEVGNILLWRAQEEIKRLGGKTNQQINREAKAKRKNTPVQAG